MNDLQRRLPGQLTAQVVEVHAGNTDAVGEGFDRQVLAVVLFDQLDEMAEQMLVAFAAAARRRIELAVTAGPDHQHTDQRVHQRIPRRCAAFVFLKQGGKQGIDIAPIPPDRVATGGGQDCQRRTQLRLQLCHQRSSESQHITLDTFRKLETMHGQRRDHLYRRFQHVVALALDLDHRLAALHIEQLEQVGVTVRLDLPMVQAAAFRDGLAMQ
ncbi:hypothetical protein D9M71_339260 [compost metagenome]